MARKWTSTDNNSTEVHAAQSLPADSCAGCQQLAERVAVLEQQLTTRLLVEEGARKGIQYCERCKHLYATRSVTVQHKHAISGQVQYDAHPQLVCDDCEPFNPFRFVNGLATFKSVDLAHAPLAREINAANKQLKSA